MNSTIYAYEAESVSPNANLSEFDSARLFTPETLVFFKEVKGREVVFLDDDAMLMITLGGITYFRESPGNSTTVMVSPENTIIAKGDNVLEAVACVENYIKRIKS